DGIPRARVVDCTRVDTEVQVGGRSGGVARVAYVADKVTDFHVLALGQFFRHALEMGVEVADPPVAEDGHRQPAQAQVVDAVEDRKSTRLNSSHVKISYAV